MKIDCRAGFAAQLVVRAKPQNCMTDETVVPPEPAPMPDATAQASPAGEQQTEINAPPVIPAAHGEPESFTFEFHGEPREYFRIWIVNTLLTILSCGIFSAWAKVRKRRYLRGNTSLMGHRFDYRADPWRLLMGQIVVVTLFGAYGVFGQVYPAVAVAALLIGLVMLPWIVVRSLAFNAHNTTYRGLRFNFRQTYLSAAVLYYGQFLLVILSFGLLYPGWLRKHRTFVIGNHRLGDAFFRLDAPVGQFYAAHIMGAGILVPAALLAGLIAAGVAANARGHTPDLMDLAPTLVVYGLGFFIAKHIVFARLFNHVWNHTKLDDHRFHSDLTTDAWVKLQLVNLVAMIGSAGLLYPWAQVRSMRLALSHLHFRPSGSLDKIERMGRAQGSALGETAGEFVGLDFGL